MKIHNLTEHLKKKNNTRLFILYGPKSELISLREQQILLFFKERGLVNLEHVDSPPIGFGGGERSLFGDTERKSVYIMRSLTEKHIPLMETFFKESLDVGVFSSSSLKTKSSFFTWAEAHPAIGIIPCFSIPSPEMINVIQDRARSLNVKISQEALFFLRQYFEESPATLFQDLSKLQLFCLDSLQIEQKDCEALFQNSFQGSAQKLFDAIITGDCSAVVQNFNSMVEKQFDLIFLVRLLIKNALQYLAKASRYSCAQEFLKKLFEIEILLKKNSSYPPIQFLEILMQIAYGFKKNR